MSSVSRRAFLGSLAAIPAAAFMPTHIAEWTVADAPLCGYAPIGDSVLAMSDGKLYRIEFSPTSPSVWAQVWVEPFDG